jgi:hypothetical protein
MSSEHDLEQGSKKLSRHNDLDYDAETERRLEKDIELTVNSSMSKDNSIIKSHNNRSNISQGKSGKDLFFFWIDLSLYPKKTVYIGLTAGG